MDTTYAWYQQLEKPSWAPPSWLFGPVWTFLYIIIAISFGFVFYQAAIGNISWYLALPFILNLIFNFAFTPLQFRLRNNYLAAIDVLFVLATLLWSLASIYPHYSWVVYVNIPYVAWTTFASILQLTITYLNAGAK